MWRVVRSAWCVVRIFILGGVPQARDDFCEINISTVSIDPLKNDDRDLAGGGLLVFGEKGHQRRLLVEQALPLLPFGDTGPGYKTLGTQLDRHLRVSHQVMVPVGWVGDPPLEAITMIRSPSRL